jgi:mycofactocin system glycosyltransferase
MDPSQLPEGLNVVLDEDVKVDPMARSIVGGTPLRVLRLSARGAEVLAALQEGATPAWTPAIGRLLRTLVDAGMAHPQPAEADAAVDWVVPILDGADRIDPGLPPGATVVHDGGPNGARLADRCADGEWRLVSFAENRGPAVARNEGAALGMADFVAFMDTGVALPPDSVATLVGHFADPQVGAVAPRVQSEPTPGLVGRFEATRSPLDLGGRPSEVRPDGRVTHVPTALLIVRRSALEEVGGFDASLRYGEDVDLVWRLRAAGWSVRYEPNIVATHPPRASWRTLWRQRSSYGSAAAALDRRHPGAVAPVRLNVWSLVTWLLLVAGRGPLRILGAGVGVASTAALARRLDGVVSDPDATAIRLGGRGTLLAGRWLGQATGRAWLPIAAGLALLTRRPGPFAVALMAPSALEWFEDRPDIDLLRWTALRVAEDTAYCHGVWTGMTAERSLRAIRPELTGIPGLDDDR